MLRLQWEYTPIREWKNKSSRAGHILCQVSMVRNLAGDGPVILTTSCTKPRFNKQQSVVRRESMMLAACQQGYYSICYHEIIYDNLAGSDRVFIPQKIYIYIYMEWHGVLESFVKVRCLAKNGRRTQEFRWIMMTQYIPHIIPLRYIDHIIPYHINIWWWIRHSTYHSDHVWDPSRCLSWGCWEEPAKTAEKLDGKACPRDHHEITTVTDGLWIGSSFYVVRLMCAVHD